MVKTVENDKILYAFIAFTALLVLK